jgi:hypothetical protein
MKDLIGKLVSIKYRDRKDFISGYLVDFNEDWTLIKYNPIEFIVDGYLILRTPGILMCENEDLFTEKVLNLKGFAPTANDIYPLTNIEETLNGISEKFGAFQLEKRDESECYVGSLLKIENDTLFLHELDPEAEWLDVEKFKLSSIKVFAFGSDYISSLIMYSKAQK